MHAMTDQGPSSVPAFLTKLWTLVEDPTTNEFICWDATGKSFHVSDQGRFSKEILPMYFKHSNISSFIRQLNMYGFRKVIGIESGGLKVEKDDMEFAHPYFQRDNESLLEFIKRKVPNIKGDEMKVKHDDVTRVLNDVRGMKGKQDSMSGKLDTLKRENEMLWLEVASLRQKHMKQQTIVNKLIQFLVSMVGNRSVDRKRKVPLMLKDTSPPAAKKSRSMGQFTMDGQKYEVRTADEPPGHSTLSLHDVTDQAEVADIMTSILHGSDDDSDLPFTHSGLNSQTQVTEENLPSEPKDILDVLSEQSNILSGSGGSPDTQVPIVTEAESPAASYHVDLPTEADPPGDGLLTSGGALSIEEFLVSDGESTSNVQSTVKPYTGSVVPSSPKPATESRTLQRTNSHPVEIEMGDHLDGLQSELEVLQNLLSGGQYTFEPSTILNLFDLGSSIMVDQPSSSVSDPSHISGNEVVQYNPPEDISSLFDLGDLTSSTPLEEDDALGTLNTPLNTPMIPATTPTTSSAPFPTSSQGHNTEEID